MIIPPQYQLNRNIVSLLQEIEHLKTQLDLVPQNKILEKYSRQRSILKSSLFSARIEGNPKNLSEINLVNIKNSKLRNKLEINNLYNALEYMIKNHWQKDLTINNLRNLHNLVMKNLSPSSGNLRTEPSAIFNEAGIAIYVCPMPEEIKPLLNQWRDYINQENEQFIAIKAILGHFSFEKIHPFLDGNGRIGRLLIHLILKKWHYDLKGLVSFEEYLDKHKDEYYYFLNISKRDITEFVEYFLTGLKESLTNTLNDRQQIQSVSNEDLLPLRRQEILQIIRDHKQVSLNFLKRRFMTVSDRLLRYDLKKLQDAGFVKKRGVTRGAVYEPKT